VPAGIRPVKGVRRIGVRLGNWLTPDQGRRLLAQRTTATARDLRDQAMLSVLIGSGLRRGELLALKLASIQQREEPYGTSSERRRQEPASRSWPHTTSGGPVHASAISPVASWIRFQFLLAHVSIQTTERYLGCKQKLRCAVNDRLGIEPDAPA
jgi:hypothetical protein